MSGALPDGDPRHGTTNGYTNCRCRCDQCRAAWSAYRKQYIASQPGYRTRDEYLAELRANRQHGIISRYQDGCRCGDCRKAAADARWRWRKNRAEREGRVYAPQRDWVLDLRAGRIA